MLKYIKYKIISLLGGIPIEIRFVGTHKKGHIEPASVWNSQFNPVKHRLVVWWDEKDIRYENK